jgi:hypothetical protein
MKSAEFDELGEEVKQAFEAHEADHQNEIKNQQSQQMMMMGGAVVERLPLLPVPQVGQELTELRPLRG